MDRLVRLTYETVKDFLCQQYKSRVFYIFQNQPSHNRQIISMTGNPTMIFAKHRSSISPPLLVLLLLLVLVFMTLSADAALTPVYMHYYCRQQCEQRFKMCAMSASESSFIFQPCILSGLSYFRVVVSCRHWRFGFSLVLIDLGYGVLTFEGGVKSVHQA